MTTTTPAPPAGEDRELQAAAHDHLLQHFGRNGGFGPGAEPLPIIVEADGLRLRDSRGRTWLDGLSALYCAQLGYGYRNEFAAAAHEQLRRVPFAVNWGSAADVTVRLADRLAADAPAGIEHVFFTNGGSESVEAAWKLVRSYHLAAGEPQRDVAIARSIAYHGVTLGALSFTGVPGIKEPFGRPAVETRHVSHTGRHRVEAAAAGEAAFCRTLLDEVERTVLDVGPERVAMLIAEPIQNGGGCFTPPEGYWTGLRALADRYGFLLVADEVISAFGRLGELFGGERYGVRPDLITVAKGLTSAYAPMGAVLASDRVAAHLFDPGRTLLHGVTFGGHPLSAAIALRNLEIFERDDVLAQARSGAVVLEHAMQELRALDVVGDVRGDGLFWAAELVCETTADGRFASADKARIVKELLPAALADVELIARPDDRGEAVVQLAPALVAEPEELREMVARLGEALRTATPAIRELTARGDGDGR